MTTGWGVDPAPHTAYQLTAALASGGEAEAARLWLSLDESSRAQVVAALGAQDRAALGGSEVLLGYAADELRADLRDCDARPAALAALEGCPAAVLPPCDGCPRPAVALARVRLRELARIGFPVQAVAEICRRAAAL